MWSPKVELPANSLIEMKKNPFTSFVIFPLQLGRVLEEIEVEDLGPEDDLDGVDFTFHDQGFYTQPAGVTQDAPVSSSTRVKDRHCDMLDCFWTQKTALDTDNITWPWPELVMNEKFLSTQKMEDPRTSSTKLPEMIENKKITNQMILYHFEVWPSKETVFGQYKCFI